MNRGRGLRGGGPREGGGGRRRRSQSSNRKRKRRPEGSHIQRRNDRQVGRALSEQQAQRVVADLQDLERMIVDIVGMRGRYPTHVLQRGPASSVPISMIAQSSHRQRMPVQEMPAPPAPPGPLQFPVCTSHYELEREIPGKSAPLSSESHAAEVPHVEEEEEDAPAQFDPAELNSLLSALTGAPQGPQGPQTS